MNARRDNGRRLIKAAFCAHALAAAISAAWAYAVEPEPAPALKRPLPAAEQQYPGRALVDFKVVEPGPVLT